MASMLRMVVLAGLMLSFMLGGARAEKVLRIGMTAFDIPLTSGQPDNGFEGFRFTGYTIYDALVNWDLSKSDRPADLRPGLAVSWKVNPTDTTKWTFELRRGVKFHDGSDFNADAVIWNFDKVLNDKSPQFDAKQSGQVRGRITSVGAYRKTDDFTIEITTKKPDSFFPYQMTFVLFSSPAHWEKLGKDWNAFAAQPSGTGPFKLARFVPRERAELVPNAGYWEPARIPKVDRVVLLPMPEATSRTAALLNGQVDWIEAPAPDTVPALKQRGMQIVSNVYPHVWTYMLSFQPGSPFTDVRVRKAINLAIDRDSLTQVLQGLMSPAAGMVPKGHPWFGSPTFAIKYDPAEAKKLLAEAGYGPQKPLRLSVAVSTSGSGQMQPIPMNEVIQQNLKEVGVELDIKVMEWEALLNRWRAGAQAETNSGIVALNTSAGTFDPFNAFFRFYSSALKAPNGLNWGGFGDPAYDALIDKIQNTFEPSERDRLLAELHAKSVDDALFVWVAHDVNPRGLSPKVKGFVQAQSWYQDLTPVQID